MKNTDWNLCFVCDGEVVEQQRVKADYLMLKYLLVNYKTVRKISFVYEAGFSGFWLYRKLTSENYRCIVTPPSQTPQTTSKVKTDKRDAQKLASFLAAGILKSIYVPPANVESDRRIVRRRAQIVKKQTRAKNEIKAFLKLFGLKPPEDIKISWSNRYLTWLGGLDFDNDSDDFTLSQLIHSYRNIRDDLALVTRYLRKLSGSPKYAKNYKHLLPFAASALLPP